MSNYPKELWKSQILKKLPVSISFDTVNEKTVRKNGVVRLGSLYGVKVVSIGGDYITAKPVSFGHSILSGSIGVLTDIQIGERETVGKFSVTLLHIDGNKATVRVTNVFKAWEEEMLKYIEPKIGDITVFDMMDWSRLHEGDLDNLRPMCEDTYEYEAVTIYKIPSKDYGTMSLGWFSPNHACSSIYVPFHNSNTDIFDPYETGEAAQLSLDLLNAYGHDVLTESFMEVETVFQNEMNSIEDKSNELSKQDLSDFLTYFDMGMQEQAYITQTLWLEANNKSEITSILDNIWNNSYLFSLFKIRNSMNQLDKISNSKVFKEKIAEIAISISDSYMNGAKLFNEDVEHIEDLSESGKKLIRQGEYEEGIDSLIQSFSAASGIIFGNEAIVGLDDNPIEEDDSVIFYILLIFLLFVAFAFLLRKMQIQF